MRGRLAVKSDGSWQRPPLDWSIDPEMIANRCVSHSARSRAARAQDDFTSSSSTSAHSQQWARFYSNKSMLEYSSRC